MLLPNKHNEKLDMTHKLELVVLRIILKISAKTDLLASDFSKLLCLQHFHY